MSTKIRVESCVPSCNENKVSLFVCNKRNKHLPPKQQKAKGRDRYSGDGVSKAEVIKGQDYFQCASLFIINVN